LGHVAAKEERLVVFENTTGLQNFIVYWVVFVVVELSLGFDLWVGQVGHASERGEFDEPRKGSGHY
jgi:hypothetical protein